MRHLHGNAGSDGEGCEIMFRVIRQRWRRVHMNFGENGNNVLCVILSVVFETVSCLGW